MKALFIGRFQPFHIGHLKVVKYILKEFDEVIIGIGSSQYSNTFDNPFTSDERIEMIKKTLEKNKIKNYKIVLIPDIHNPPKWVEHVLSIYSDFDTVFTNNKFTKELFEKKGYKVLKTPVFNKKEYSGENIRNKISKNEFWEDLVPQEVSKYIKETNAVERIQKNI